MTPVKGFFEEKKRGKSGQEKEDELVLDGWEVLEDEPGVRPSTISCLPFSSLR